MDHIEQLKKIRAEAIARMRNSPDFKLAGKLGQLIVELGETIDDTVDYADDNAQGDKISKPFAKSAAVAAPLASVTPRPFQSTFSKPDADAFDDLTSDEMIDELVAEIENDAAELDALMVKDEDAEADKDAASTEEKDGDTIGPFLKPLEADAKYANGAAH